MEFDFVKYRKIYFIFSGIIILGSLILLAIFSLNWGIEFTGGSILEIEFRKERPENKIIKENLKEFNLGEIFIQPTNEKGVILRIKDISEETHQRILEKLGDVEEKRFESIGPTIGKELKEKTKIVVLFSLLAIVVYIAFAFRKITRPVASWQYGIVSSLCLIHDILITLGIFSILGKYLEVQITIPIVTALLVIVGYSINNTVVVYDRIREILLKFSKLEFTQIVNQAINQTLTRQINTSLTTLFPLIFIFFFGGETLKYFALTLIIGISVGTYSSIFLAGPILINLKKKH